MQASQQMIIVVHLSLVVEQPILVATSHIGAEHPAMYRIRLRPFVDRSYQK
jgi:hypothetical protein